MSKAVHITANQVQELLKYRHSKDVYVPECKNGSTWFANHLRLDGLAIARSWSNPMVTGYEIKVHRGDFMRDDKLYLYAKYCNAMYLVCPSKLIMPEEVPEGMGLMWVATTGSRIFTKVKAPYREIDEPADLYKYILISRAKIFDDDLMVSRGLSGKDYWTQWLRNREIDFHFGQRVGNAIQRRVEEEINEVQRENRHLLGRIGAYADILRKLENAGIDINQDPWAMRSAVDNKIEKLRGELPRWFDRDIDQAIEHLTKIKNVLSREDGNDRT
jgi:hypothetical protein